MRAAGGGACAVELSACTKLVHRVGDQQLVDDADLQFTTCFNVAGGLHVR